MRRRSVCVHGHFYQPPRECPWSKRVERQPSASPFHDWNDRICHECYAPNARARVVSDQSVVLQLVNNYAYMSFNFGATLLSWMAEHAQSTLTAIVEANKISRQRLNGHGNAMAQVYSHMILPLASAHDRKTQVLWGKAAFQHYFGHEPEGMHLAETAANTETLEALAAQGIKFTLLAPRQAKAWRKIGSDKWESGGGVDPSRAYLCKLPSGRSITLFFYDGPISQAVAFEHLLNGGEAFRDRLLSGFNANRSHNEMVHIAVDGETIGHHHRHGEMCLAWVIDSLRSSDVELSNYGHFMSENPAEYEVQIHENSSWSCAHGIERWRSNCGCNAGTGQQEWRGPLRLALDNLRKKLDEIFEKKGKKYFRNAWEARNAYIAVLLDRNKTEAFLGAQCRSGLSSVDLDQALRLLEMQRFGMLMYTSCGWFFDEISGLEPTQNLRYAAKAMQLAGFFTDEDLEYLMMKDLEAAPSNIVQFGNGRGVWEQIIRKEAAAKEIDTLANESLSTLPEIERLSKRFRAVRELVGTWLDATVQNRVLNAYARLQTRGELNAKLQTAFIQLAEAIGLSESLLGWKEAGINDLYTNKVRRWRMPNSVSALLSLLPGSRFLTGGSSDEEVTQ